MRSPDPDRCPGPEAAAHLTSIVRAGPSHGYETPTGEPCPRSVRFDGTVEGSGNCLGCGTCLLGSGLT